MHKIILAAVLLGFSMMAIQTVLTRLGGLALGASHFTFSMVVAVFVLCIALGSLAVAALACWKNGGCVRVHDVRETVKVPGVV